MATPAQITANRLNAQKSTGPRTDEGKDISRMNSFKHGLTSTKVYPAAKQEEFQSLAAAYHDELQPVGVCEEQRLEALVHARWGLRRLYELQEQAFETLMHEDESKTPSQVLIADFRGARVIEKLHRYQRDLQRTHDRALGELRELQGPRRNRLQLRESIERQARFHPAHAAQLAAQNGFVLSTDAEPPLNPALRNPQVASQRLDNPALRL
jgi:hypothetical protein